MNMQKKPSFFRTLTRKVSQKSAVDIPQRSATISTSTPRLMQIEGNMHEFYENEVNQQNNHNNNNNNDNFKFQRATLPLPLTKTIPKIEMLTVEKTQPDVLLHASIISLNSEQPQQQQQEMNVQQKLSSSPSLSSLSSLERFSSFSSNFDIAQYHKNHNHDINGVCLHDNDDADNDDDVDYDFYIDKKFENNDIFKKISKSVIEEKKYLNNDSNWKIIDKIMPEIKINNNNNENINEIESMPVKPPRKHEKKNLVVPIENKIIDLFEEATSIKLDNNHNDNIEERLSIDFGTDSDELDEIQTRNEHVWQQFTWDIENNNEEHKQQPQQPQQLRQAEEDNKKQQFIEMQQQQHQQNKENPIFNNNNNNTAFGKSIDEDWENFEELAQTPTTLINTLKSTSHIINKNDIFKENDETTIVNNNNNNNKNNNINNHRKISRGNLKVTFDLNDKFLPIARNHYDSDSSCSSSYDDDDDNNAKYDWHKIRKKYVNAITKDTEKILTSNEDFIKLPQPPPPLPLSSPPILILSYNDDDDDDDDDNNKNYSHNWTDNDSIMSINIKPIESNSIIINKMPPQARPRTTVQVHHAMNEDISEHSTDA